MKNTCHSELVSESNKSLPQKLGGDIEGESLCSIALHNAPHPNPPRSRGGKKAAFTLAEVLITLGIIGVVAAITIPTLMTKIQHKQYTARLKKFYSTMKQMNISAEEEFGDISGWDKTLPKEEFLKKYFVPYLKGNIQTVESDVYFIFNDGSSFILNYGTCVDILYDVNGFSKPNKDGYDIFRLLYCPPEGVHYCNGHGGFCTYHAVYDDTREKRLTRCKNSPHFCAGLLEYDNWEFANDYPWK